MTDCIFCDIASGEMDADVVYEDDRIVAFEDANPQAPVHLLVIPKNHIESLEEVPEDEFDLIADIHKTIQKLARSEGIAESGYRVVNNCGEEGGQTVGHVHFHLLGGRELSWPPG
ncbi:histidine triad nucleotide-binding protein [Halarsenatibacter silvermanii]|uniref:Histidine triad (HIT) family protein n=1 Tax=Halarsenatibacter silvermanii TaxID=321763 RepID=A0A1G9JWF5_9FIRM|nr:histidine triad nucleotide-binding protein [Halarsenatibacter silvermanii]SDL41515.1 histidine triad (HIT) family protein [Halarsenatibacter silvermanii]